MVAALGWVQLATVQIRHAILRGANVCLEVSYLTLARQPGMVCKRAIAASVKKSCRVVMPRVWQEHRPLQKRRSLETVGEAGLSE